MIDRGFYGLCVYDNKTEQPQLVFYDDNEGKSAIIYRQKPLTDDYFVVPLRQLYYMDAYKASRENVDIVCSSRLLQYILDVSNILVSGSHRADPQESVRPLETLPVSPGQE